MNLRRQKRNEFRDPHPPIGYPVHYFQTVSTWEKHVLAWWMQGRTSVSRGWMAEHLAMGYKSRVSQAIRWVKSNRAVEVLEKLEDDFDKL